MAITDVADAIEEERQITLLREASKLGNIIQANVNQ